MRDDLVGFVLGALDPEQQESVRRRVEQDHELQRQVQLVERSLRPLAALKLDIQPPRGLAARTCDCLSLATRPGGLSEAAGEAVRTRQPAIPVSRMPAWGVDRAGGYGDTREWTLADFVVAAGVCLAAACLFFPALSNSRYNMQLTGCQNNMRKMAQAFAGFSDLSGGYFPVIPASGNASFAGAYAPMLLEKGLLYDLRVLSCPSKGNTVVLRGVTMQEIARAQGPQLVRIHRTAGGDYSYGLGYLYRGRLRGIRNRGDAQTPILADSVLENLRNAVVTTHARGQNVLFADGHAAFVGTRIRPGSERDDLFYNDRGEVSAGSHAQDFVLAPSHASPLPVGRSSSAGSRTPRS